MVKSMDIEYLYAIFNRLRPKISNLALKVMSSTHFGSYQQSCQAMVCTQCTHACPLLAYMGQKSQEITHKCKIHIFKDVQIAKKHVNKVFKSMQCATRYITGLQNVVEWKYKVAENGKLQK